ncbi:Mediator complex subunit Med18 [Botryosphaeria dothidea]|uniref:Mediator of RNA polymerase II transcription subunit 18 n=1 Tax=Botryosphaeria dothidea TaxID=55169 RepID=A0A8H4J6X6_9PEZI|nr:Mediator complex subunit Med18 [Botryosphaeria dothidea]
MPHELLLFAQLPNSRHDQLLNILAGISGAQPQRVIERHVVYRPQRDPLQRQYAVGASQNVQTTQRATSREQLSKDMYYWQTVKELDEADFGPAQQTPTAASTEHFRKEEASPDAERKGWTILFQDIPEPGQRPVNMRWVQTADIIAGDPHAHMKATMYNYVSEYIDEGFQFVYQNTTIFLHRILRLPSPEQPRDRPLEILPPLKDLEPLDRSGAFVVQVSIKIHDNYKPETREKAQAELLALKGSLKGVLELDPAERLALDTRVKARPG